MELICLLEVKSSVFLETWPQPILVDCCEISTQIRECPSGLTLTNSFLVNTYPCKKGKGIRSKITLKQGIVYDSL